MNLASRIVVLGGYGNFGTRVARALAQDARYDIVIAGRDATKANALADGLAREYPAAYIRGAEIDCASEGFVRRLGTIAPIVVVHAAGPFQGQDYRVAEACLACRSHYVDLADGRRFVAGIGALDREARRRDVLLVSGASTLPGISSAVVNALTADLQSISSIECSIAPAGSSPRGVATVAAVLSYCGKPIRVLDRGTWAVRYGWQGGQIVKYPYFARRVAVCDVPDLELFPTYYPSVDSVTFHAAPESIGQQAALWLMAAAVRVGLVDDWSRYAPSLARIDRWTGARGRIGAMRVEVRGQAPDGTSVKRVWDLTAGSNHGPEVPCAPAIALTRKLASGGLGERGAKPCLGLVDMRDLELTLAGFDVEWTVTDDCASDRASGVAQSAGMLGAGPMPLISTTTS